MTVTDVEETLIDRLDPGHRTGLVVATLAATGIVVSLAQTLVVPIITQLPEIFHTDASNASWIITITLLVGAIATPVIGRLGDLYGKKKMLVVALVPFVVGSILCALAADLVPMIVGRGLQGLGTGMIPLGISLLHDVLPREKSGSAVALMSSSLGIGGALGLPFSAAISQYASWRVLFWVIAAAGVLALIAIVFFIPVHDPKSHNHGFDYVGTAGLSVGLVALLLAISKGAEWGWGSPLTIGGFVIGAVVLVLWGWYEITIPHPLVDLRTTVKPVVLLTNLASILVGFSMYALNLIIPQVLQFPVELGFGLGLPLLGMGLCMVPMGIAMAAVSKFGSNLSRRRGPKVTLTVAGITVAIGYAAIAIILSTLGNRQPGPADAALLGWTATGYVVGGAIVGVGIGLAFGSMPALIMSSVPASEKAAANGFNSLMRSFGSTVSAAIIGVVLAQFTQQLSGHTVPTIAGFTVSLSIGAAAALIAALLAAVIPGRPGIGQAGAH